MYPHLHKSENTTQSPCSQINSSTNHNPAPSDDEDSEDEDSEDEDDDDSDSDCSEHYQRRRPQPPSATGGGVRRSSICAEKLSIGKMNSSREINGNSSDSDTLNMDNGNEKKNSTPKTKEESEKITQILKTNVLFQHLDEEQMQKVLNAMFLVQKEQDDVIIQQGDGGDNFYILESGEVNVFIRKDEKMVSNSVSDDPEADGGDNDKSNEQKQHELKYGKLVTTYKNEASFGELAIMYNAPRAATCVAVNGPVRLWALDRVSFKVILMQTAISTRETNKGFLQNVPILSDLTMYELLTIADSLVEESFSNGATIFKEGDHGDKFYIIKEGVAVCSKVNNATEKSIEVARLKEGAYFGEIALVTPKRRQATVTASGNLKCLTLDRKTFKRVMGPIEQILMRNIENYNKFQAANI